LNTIRKREIRGYFHTPVGYVFIGVFLAVSSVLFYMQILRQRSGDLPNFIAEMSYLWMLLSPVLTMRLLAEEKQKKTDQLLLTSPVSLPGIVVGKYLAAVTVLLITAGLTLFFVLIVALYGTIYPAELAVNYLGFILQGCAFVALDLFISGCAGTPVTAAVMAFGANFLLWILDLLENAVQVGWVSDVLRFLSLYRRNEPFVMGQLSFAGLLFDLSFIAAFLILTVYHLDRRRYSR
jgi:ABC-2 type transport system permease protein